MDSDKRKGSPEREQTDAGLRGERERTDRALAEKRHDVEADADRVIERARDHADAVLDAARDKADSALVAAGGGTSQESVEDARALEDEALHAERAAADETLRVERERSARALADLLPLEREKTDRYLLTERVRADDALSHRDDFLGIVSHDLRNLLGGIVVSAEVLSRAAPECAAAGTEAGRIKRYAARMNSLIGDLLDVVSIDAGQLAVKPQPGDFSAMIREAVDMFRGAASARGIALDIVKLEGDCEIAFDHDRMLQVLANLITNAIKFTPDGGRIALSCDGAGSELRLSIEDTGPGIPADMLDAVFERFWQAGSDRRGLGLGLYISRYIVEAHGGSIVAANAPGRGAMLTVTLPRRSGPA